MDEAKLLVIGAGVNGSLCATNLHKAGFNVTLLARGKRYEELQSTGIILEDQFAHTRTETRVPVTNSLDPADYYDYILVVVRKNQVAALLPVLAQNVSPNIVFLVNNPSGPEEFTKALGCQRVMQGFVFGAGRREGNVIRGYFPKGSWAVTPFGEIDGTLTPRLTRLVNIFRQAGMRAKASRNSTDWLATHAALVPCFAMPIMKYNLDAAALAKSRAEVGLIVDAMRETLDVLEAVGFRVTPWSNSSLRYIPRFLFILLLQWALPSQFMQVGGVWHVSQAPDEMRQLAAEVEAMVEKSGLRVPELRTLLAMKPA
jgi:2-dehydropantoate 2-reductase